MNVSFRYPLLACTLQLVPLLLVLWVWWRRGRGVVLPFDHGQGKSGKGYQASINLAQCLPALLFSVVLAILCGPQQLSEPRTKRRLTNIEFCVDISGSMTASFGSGSRYDVSMQAINDFLDFRQGDAFGLTFFGNSVLHWVPLTTDPSAIRFAPPYMRPENAPPGFGGTEIGKALLACRRRLLESQQGDRMILLVSDGASFDLSNGNDASIAGQLKDSNIVVYAVHISETEVPAEIVNVTRLTGGEVFHPGDEQGLRMIFQRIDAMQQAELEKIAAETMDHFFPYCVAGLSLLGLSAFVAVWLEIHALVIELATVGVAVAVLAAEWLHARRCRRLARLAFGPAGRPAIWARAAPILRVASLAALTWGLGTLLAIDPKVHQAESVPDGELKHVMLVLDVSPSMRLQDAGVEKKQSRRQRALALMDSFFKRIAIQQYRISVIAVYNGAKPVVIDTRDVEVVRNILDDLPMEYAFPAGKTDIFAGLQQAASVAQPWNPRSTTIVLLTDGDTVPATGMPKMPAAVANVLIIGVGDPVNGKFIDGQQSRQDTSTLRQVAARLGGTYHNGNELHLSTTIIKGLTEAKGGSRFEQLTRRECALIACGLGGVTYAFLPLCLHWAGTRWNPGARVSDRVRSTTSQLVDSRAKFQDHVYRPQGRELESKATKWESG